MPQISTEAGTARDDMALRWIFGPTVKIGGCIKPRVAALTDPARPLVDDGSPEFVPGFKALAHSSVYNADRTKALSLVGGDNLSLIDLTSGVVDMLDGGFSRADRVTYLNKTPAQLKWSGEKFTRVRDRFLLMGMDISQDVPLYRWLNEFGRRANPAFDVDNHFTSWR